MCLIAGCSGTASDAGSSSPTGKAAEITAATAPTAESASGLVAAGNGSEPAAKPAPPAKPAGPTDTRQLVEVLDLGKIPAPEDDVRRAVAHPPQRWCTTVGARGGRFLPRNFGALGWQPVGLKRSESITESFAQVSLGKDGYLLRLMAMPGEPKETTVSIEHVGNFDTRTLPRVEGAEDQYSDQSSSLYFTTMKVDEATARLRQLLKADGWQEYDQAFSQKANRPDASDLLFRKKAYNLRASISKPAAAPTKSAVEYIVTTLARDLPAPADAKHVEIQDSRWILMCEVPRT